MLLKGREGKEIANGGAGFGALLINPSGHKAAKPKEASGSTSHSTWVEGTEWVPRQPRRWRVSPRAASRLPASDLPRLVASHSELETLGL